MIALFYGYGINNIVGVLTMSNIISLAGATYYILQKSGSSRSPLSKSRYFCATSNS
jgi:hypothetical protein